MADRKEVTTELTIEAGLSEKNYWGDLWRFRELFYILSWRDIKVRYKQTAMGAAWGVIRPLLTMIIFSLVFGRVANLAKSTTYPYSLLVFTGLLPWQFFSTAMSDAGNSLISNTNLISKVYFPRMIIPASAVITSLVDFAISFGILLAMMIFFHFVPSPRIFMLPVFIVLTLALSLGVGLYAAALNVKFRDFRYIIPFIMLIGVYVTPVGYSSTRIAEQFSPRARLWYSLNPVVGIIDGFRWSILGEPIYWPAQVMSLFMTILFVGLGFWYFRKTEKGFADNI
jgi:lipopolysaccharide transport system permease protein